MSRILIVEDNVDLGRGLANNLEIEGHETIVALDGETGLAAARAQAIDLVILDLMLPDQDGLRVLATLREEGNDVPVLILSARNEEIDKVRGFRLGADDYVTKPFGLLELLGRVQAILRRAGSAPRPADGVQRFGDLEIDPAARTVRRGGELVDLRPREYDLLELLVRRQGRVVSRMELLRDVWGYGTDVVSRTVDTHIAELRRKLEADPSEPRHILTIRKTGYRWKGTR